MSNENLDEIVSVNVRMTRRDFNRLTHVMNTESYELSAQRACFDQVAKFRSPFKNTDTKPYKNDVEID